MVSINFRRAICFRFIWQLYFTDIHLSMITYFVNFWSILFENFIIYNSRLRSGISLWMTYLRFLFVIQIANCLAHRHIVWLQIEFLVCTYCLWSDVSFYDFITFMLLSYWSWFNGSFFTWWFCMRNYLFPWSGWLQAKVFLHAHLIH